jgi:very-short-patch-repair endonuclease
MKTGIAIWRFAVLRFENRFVFQEPEYIKSEIRKVLNKRNESTG